MREAVEDGHADNTDTNALDVNLSNVELLELITKPLQQSEEYWNKTFGLHEVRRVNKNLWLPDHWKDSGQEAYDYQQMSLYVDNRIFTSTETISSTVNARIPQVEIMPGQDTEISLNMAKDLQKTCFGYTEKYDVLDLFRLSARNLQLKRGAFIKLRFDPNKGEHGEIVSEFVQPEDTIVDKDAKMGEIPRFFAHRIRNHTVEELIALLPDAEQAILKAAGVNRHDSKGNLVAYKTQLGRKMDIYEVWFRYLEEGQTKSGVCWVDVHFAHVLDKMANPNWNYDAKEGSVANILDEPAPPFIPINYLNDGSSYFDQTTLIEQAAPLQRILDKRGFQIMENADQAGSGLVFNTQMISKNDIAKLTGSPDERIGVKGSVRDAVARVTPPPLPAYVIQDKQDARNEIDNIFATHDVSRGERSKNVTLGQDVMQQRQDLTRMDDIARAVERQATHYYRYLVQMMKVYYTEKHFFKAVGEDGQFDFVAMHSDLIQNGVDIRVAAGSMLPIDKVTQQKWVSDLLNKGMIDPLTVYEVAAGGNMPSPKKMLERWIKFKTDPLAFAGLTKEEDFNREALLDIQVLNDGKMPKVRDEYSPTYLKFINNYMLGGEFEKQKDAVKLLYIDHIRIVQMILAKQMERLMTQMPSQDELDIQNQKSAQQAALESQIAGAQPQPSGQGGPGEKGAAGPGSALGGQASSLAEQMVKTRPQPAMAM